MTDEMMNLCALFGKEHRADLVREMIGFTAQRLMELEVEGLTSAADGERSRTGSISATATVTGYSRRFDGKGAR